MRQRRDPFARITYTPHVAQEGECVWCGRSPQPRLPLRYIDVEHDGGKTDVLRGVFCSWSCAESYHGSRIGR